MLMNISLISEAQVICTGTILVNKKEMELAGKAQSQIISKKKRTVKNVQTRKSNAKRQSVRPRLKHNGSKMNKESGLQLTKRIKEIRKRCKRRMRRRSSRSLASKKKKRTSESYDSSRFEFFS